MATFTWTAGTLGVWNDPASWTGPGVPTGIDTAIISVPVPPLPAVVADVVQGPGAAAVLQTTGTVILDGVFAIADVAVGVNGMLAIGTGDALTADQVAGADGSSLFLNGGTLDVAGDVAVGGSLTVRAGAVAQFGGLTLDGATVTFDSTSILQIGTTGVGSPGTVVVGSGASLTATGQLSFGVASVLNDGTISGSPSASVSLGSGFVIQGGVNNGVMSEFDMLDNFAFGFFPPLTGLLNNGTIISGVSTSLLRVTGAGTLQLSNSGTFQIGNTVEGTIDFSALDTTVVLHDTSSGQVAQGTDLRLRNFGADDRLLLQSSLTHASYTLLSPTEGRLDLTTARGSISLIVEGDYTAHPLLEFASGAEVRVTGNQFIVICFVTDTRLQTARGPVKVQDLRVGDLVVSALDKAHRPVRWIGHRSLDLTRHPSPRDAMPVRIRAGAFARGQPVRDLLLSPDHALYHDGVLIPVKYLINDTSVARVPMDRVTYWHVELDRHDVVLAEGLPAESYLDIGDRGFFANGGGVVTLHPTLAPLAREAGACAPLTVTGPVVDGLRARLAAPLQRSRRRRSA